MRRRAATGGRLSQGHADFATQAQAVGWAAEDGAPCAAATAYGGRQEAIHPNMRRPDLAAAALPAGTGFALTLAEPPTASRACSSPPGPSRAVRPAGSTSPGSAGCSTQPGRTSPGTSSARLIVRLQASPAPG